VKKKPVSGPVLRYNAGSGFALKPLLLVDPKHWSKTFEQPDVSDATDGVFSLTVTLLY
jgi:hypothetical protein